MVRRYHEVMAKKHHKQHKPKKDRLTPDERARRLAAHRAQAEKIAAERKEQRELRREQARLDGERKNARRENSQMIREACRKLLEKVQSTFDVWSDERDVLTAKIKSTSRNPDATPSDVSRLRAEVEKACMDRERRDTEASNRVMRDMYGDLVPSVFGTAYASVERSGLLDDVTLPLLCELVEASMFRDTEHVETILDTLKQQHRGLFERIPLRRTLSKRIAEVSTPYGQWLDRRMFQERNIADNVPAAGENILGTIMGTAVELLVRTVSEEDDSARAFAHARTGAMHNNRMEDEPAWERMILDGTADEQAVAAVMLGAMECTYRSGQTYAPPEPNPATVEHLLSMASTLRSFLDSQGGVSSAGVDFRQDAFTPYVKRAEGDFLTPGALWDCKASVKKPEGNQLLQILGYWILGVGSGDPVFAEIDRIGIVNPRLGMVWTAHVGDLPLGVVLKTASYIIGYDTEDARYGRVVSRYDSLHSL